MDLEETDKMSEVKPNNKVISVNIDIYEQLEVMDRPFMIQDKDKKR